VAGPDVEADAVLVAEELLPDQTAQGQSQQRDTQVLSTSSSVESKDEGEEDDGSTHCSRQADIPADEQGEAGCATDSATDCSSDLTARRDTRDTDAMDAVPWFVIWFVAVVVVGVDATPSPAPSTLPNILLIELAPLSRKPIGVADTPGIMLENIVIIDCRWARGKPQAQGKEAQ
jgi:hypothetical protein